MNNRCEEHILLKSAVVLENTALIPSFFNNSFPSIVLSVNLKRGKDTAVVCFVKDALSTFVSPSDSSFGSKELRPSFLFGTMTSIAHLKRKKGSSDETSILKQSPRSIRLSPFLFTKKTWEKIRFLSENSTIHRRDHEKVANYSSLLRKQIMIPRIFKLKCTKVSLDLTVAKT